MPKAPTPEEIRALIGHQFPGGSYTIAHWENFLLTECTGAEPLPDDLAHPVALFHVPILGANTSIKGMFALGQAESDFSIGIESYVWEIFQPLLEETPYRITGEVVEADRRSGDGRIFDRIAFRFEMFAPNETLSARATITWHYRRSFESNPSEQADLNKHVEAVGPSPAAAELVESPTGVRVGDEVPPWVMARVAPERMRTMAAILRDPNPVHWDPSVVEKLGFGHHTINQGPLGLSYMINMLHAWTGPAPFAAWSCASPWWCWTETTSPPAAGSPEFAKRRANGSPTATSGWSVRERKRPWKAPPAWRLARIDHSRSPFKGGDAPATAVGMTLDIGRS